MFVSPSLITSAVFVFMCLCGEFSDSFRTEMDAETKELLAWEAPYEYRKNFPYFLSGYDAEGSPVWVCEFGKWNMRDVLENADEETIRVFDKYLTQVYTRIFESPRDAPKREDGDQNEEFVVIEDAEGYTHHQFSHPATLARTFFILRGAVELERKHGERLKQGYSINNNFIAANVWNLAKPILGAVANRIVVLGTNEEKWKPMLIKAIPKESLPEWMGGFKNHTPIEIYGK